MRPCAWRLLPWAPRAVVAEGVTRNGAHAAGEGGAHGVGVFGGGQHQAAGPAEGTKLAHQCDARAVGQRSVDDDQVTSRAAASAYPGLGQAAGLDDLDRAEAAQRTRERLAHERRGDDHHGCEAPSTLLLLGRETMTLDQCGHWGS